jgi:hypothetical protein
MATNAAISACDRGAQWDRALLLFNTMAAAGHAALALSALWALCMLCWHTRAYAWCLGAAVATPTS